QLAVVQPVEGRLVFIEHDLYLFIGAGISHPGAHLRPVAAADPGDRAGRAAYTHTGKPAAAAGTTRAAAAVSAAAVATAAASSSAASQAAVQRGAINAAARSRRIARQHGA